MLEKGNFHMSKWIKHLSVRHQTLETVQREHGKTFPDMGVGKDGLIKIPIAQKIITDQLGCVKLKSFYTTKGKKMIGEKPYETEKIFANYISGRGLISRAYKELKC